MDKKTACAHVREPTHFTYSSRDAIIYALSVGARAAEDVKFVYESHEDFQVLPSFVVAPGFEVAHLANWPGIDFDLRRVLHGEQYIEVYAPLPDDGEMRSEARVVDIIDKEKFALILCEVTTYNASTGQKIAMQQFSTFQSGSGNFGGARTSPHEKKTVPIPTRTPDAIVEQKTSPDQAALYRMGAGDLNPLHVDPEFAKNAGFDTPILHGLCTLGFACRHVLAEFGANDASKFRAMKVRFSSPVIPGQTLVTEMWKEEEAENRVVFQVKVKETGKVVIANSYVDLVDIVVNMEQLKI